MPFALKRNIDALKKDLEEYRIRYDVWFSESSLYEDGEVRETLDILTENGCTYEKEGALWFEATRFGCDKDEVLVRANGLCTYFLADIAYHRNKILKRNFERCINIWGADHHGHVARLKAALDAVGLNGSKLDVVIMQLVRLVRAGEVVKVSKRSGKAIALRDLIDEVGVDAARFFFNLRQSDTHLEFDLQLALEQSAQNPVYYVQYAHARIRSVLSLLKQQEVEVKTPGRVKLSLLTEKEEVDLIDMLAAFPEEIRMAAVTYDPSRVTRYAIELASCFHKFYNAHRVNCEDHALRDARVILCDCVRIVIRNALAVLSVEAPERM
ncbi:Arginine--tRNA ligase [bioreactor metagenome]|uniref:arginine--tRNA ligase n=1 Tax=bioreactor metagenome TaxID=1076179 RepID=A0A645EV55_9ZZZZ